MNLKLRFGMCAAFAWLFSAGVCLASDWPQSVYPSAGYGSSFGGGGSTFTLVNVATVSFGGTAQPVSATLLNQATVTVSGTVATSGGVSTMTIVSGGVSTMTLVNVATASFAGTAQPVYLVGTPTTTFNGTAQPQYIVGTPTVTFNGTAQPSYHVGTDTVTFNGAPQPVFQVQSPTVTFNGTAQPIYVVGTPTVTFNSSAQPVIVTSTDNTKATYRAAASFSPTGTATDIWELYGSATKTVKVRSIMLTGTQATASQLLVFLDKRSTANSGGTKSGLTMVPMDSSFAVATATTSVYTANPTTGTLVGRIVAETAYFPAAATTTQNVRILWTFGAGGLNAPLILRGTGEGVTIDFNNAAGPSSAKIWVEWTEE